MNMRYPEASASQEAFDELTDAEKKIVVNALQLEQGNVYEAGVSCMPKVKLAFLQSGLLVQGFTFEFFDFKNVYPIYVELVAERHFNIAKRIQQSLFV